MSIVHSRLGSSQYNKEKVGETCFKRALGQAQKYESSTRFYIRAQGNPQTTLATTRATYSLHQ